MNLILSSNVAGLFFATVAAAFLPAAVNGHAFMTEPPTRNSYANTRANWGSIAGVPPAETTPQGLNSNTNVCGKEGGNKDYDEWLDSTGKPMPWFSHVTYDRGEEIRVDVKVTAHHFGHFEVKACPNGRSSTQECFDQNPLMYVEEIVNNRLPMPKDEANPHRAMLVGEGKEVSYKMKLPDNIVGDEVLLQWVYWTANNCNYDGYDDYFQTNASIMPPTKNWNSGLSGCGDQSQIPMIRTGTVKAEIFVNCAEITVLGDGSPVSPRPPPPIASPTMPVASPTMLPVPDPTMKPVSMPVQAPQPLPTSKPVSVAPPPTGDGGCGEPCCSQNFKSCAGWGGDSQSSCESMGSMKWLECGAIDIVCTAKDASCTNSVDSCCPGLTCDGTEWYRQCKYLPNSGRHLKEGSVRSF